MLLRRTRNSFYLGKKDALYLRPANPRNHYLIGNEISQYMAGYYTVRESQQTLKADMILHGTPRTIIAHLTEAGI